MKNLLYSIGIILMLASCSGSEDKAVKLEQLKKERDQLSIQILNLEKELYPDGNVKSVRVSTDTLHQEPFSHYIEVQGRIDGNENIGVSPRTPGVVNRILVKEGDHVTNGEVLAELDAEVLKQTLKELESQLDFATELYNKQKALWDQKIGSEIQFLTAQNNKESLENKIATINDQIKMSNITSPIDGTIEEIPIKVGQMAAVGFPAFRVVNFSKAKAVADVGEAYTNKIKTGDQVQVFLPDLDEEFDRRVTFSSKYINPTNRTFVVEAELPTDHMIYRANMIAVLRIKDYHNPSTIAIPQNFIQSSRDEGQYVFVADVDKGVRIARKAYIKTGITYNGLTEIETGLNKGDLLITAGYKDLYDGQPINF
ncbi:MAG: efflux RND transporter periplasmic adaptor subunit [Bacteroidetes bacterium]|nr:MAG: efflux RND transporter periplasmic adaptor subunit [Bacteroidota bacterium]